MLSNKGSLPETLEGLSQLVRTPYTRLEHQVKLAAEGGKEAIIPSPTYWGYYLN